MQLKSLHILLLLLVIVNCSQAQLNAKLIDDSQVQQGKRTIYAYNHFKNKLPFAVADSVVTFFLRGNTEAKKVFLCGSFSNWTPEAIPMRKTDSGWVALAKLISGKNLYKFIIDGNWNIDDDNLLIEQDDQGNVNSIYYKTNVVFTIQGFSKTKKVWLAASFNNWRMAELSLKKTASGWEIPLYLSDGTYSYKFRTDNEWHSDSKNNNRLPDKTGGFNSVINIGNSGLMKDLNYYQNELTTDEKHADKTKIAVSLLNMGNAYMRSGIFENAKISFERALVLYEQLKNQDSILSMCLKVSDACRKLADMPCELIYLQRAVTGFEKNGNKKGLTLSYKHMGYYYLNLAQWSKAIGYFERTIPMYEGFNDQIEVGNMLGNLAHAYANLPDYDKEFFYLQKSMTVNQRINNKTGLANNFWILSDYCKIILNDTLRAYNSLQRAYELFQETGFKPGMAEALSGMAYMYLQSSDSILKAIGIKPKEKYTRAIETQKKSMELYVEVNQLPRLDVMLLFISQTYEKAGAFDSAFHYYKQYVNLNQSIFGTDKQKDIVRLETKYEYEKKEDSLKLQQDLTDEKLQTQLLLFKQQQQQLELNQNQLALSEKEKDLQHLAYLKTQADLKNEQLNKQQNEKENQLKSAQVKSLTQEKAINKLNQQRQWIFIVGVLVLIGLGVLYFIHKSRLRTVLLENQLTKEKTEQRIKEAEFQHRLADISMSALRSQMNPHFIFNCLNSIKLYTLQNDTTAASEYLTKFSKLIRIILENSRNDRITLASEIIALKLYIEMEAMRFKEKLSYNISINKNVETDYVEIPPLLLQPFVENAIWHGLMYKEKGGKIDINIYTINEGTTLFINITDNGIGRHKAAELKSKMAEKHKSYGMKATSERIALINQIYKAGADVVVNDLVDEVGQPEGTEVIIQISI